jgi:hypothetical protein
VGESVIDGMRQPQNAARFVAAVRRLQRDLDDCALAGGGVTTDVGLEAIAESKTAAWHAQQMRSSRSRSPI